MENSSNFRLFEHKVVILWRIHTAVLRSARCKLQLHNYAPQLLLHLAVANSLLACECTGAAMSSQMPLQVAFVGTPNEDVPSAKRAAPPCPSNNHRRVTVTSTHLWTTTGPRGLRLTALLTHSAGRMGSSREDFFRPVKTSTCRLRPIWKGERTRADSASYAARY